MNLEQLSTMTELELQAIADQHLEQLDNRFASQMEKDHHVSQAQFLLAELDRRKQAKERTESEKIAARDYKMELWVIGLIGAELVLAIVGIVFGWTEGHDQTKVLDQLNKSSAETAATLTALRQAQEASLETQKQTLENITTMNSALQDQIDLNLTGAIQWSGGSSENAFFGNRSSIVLWFCGSKFANEPVAMRQRPTIFTPGSSITLDLSNSVAKTLKATGTTTEMTIPFELYLKRENGTKYVAKGTVQVNRNNNVNYIGQMTTTRRQW